MCTMQVEYAGYLAVAALVIAIIALAINIKNRNRHD